MCGRLAIAVLFIAACAAPLRVADRAQAVPRSPGTARVAVAGVRVDLTAGDERGWLGSLPPGLMPVETTIRNESGAPIRIRPGHFVLVQPSGVRKQAMKPGALFKALRTLVPSLAPGSMAPSGLPVPGGPAERTALALLYAWPGLHGAGSVALSDRLRPDPRPRPEGLLLSGSSGSTVLFFEVDQHRLTSFVLEVSVESEDGEVLGTAQVPYAR